MTVHASELELPRVPVFEDGDRQVRRAVMRELSSQAAIARTDIGYAVLRYDTVTKVLRDKRWHSATGFAAQFAGITDEKFLSRRRVSILNAEGDTHVRLRRLVAPAFSPRSADRLRPFMREVVEGLITPRLAAGRTEFVADVCEPYPIPIICELLGAPKEDWRSFSVWATDILRVFNGTLAQDVPVIMKAQDELGEYVRNLIDERRAGPADDLLTDLIAAEEQGDRLTNDELVMMVEAVIVGGTDTTRNQLGLCLAVFLDHPDQWALLASDPSLAPRAVEECMRYWGAVNGTIRFASEDIEMDGVLFPKGTFMSTSLATANFDPAVFPDPGTFDITREPVGSPHMSFGSGIHYCLGASLARAELQEALTVLPARLPGIRRDGDTVMKPATTAIFGPAAMPIAFDTTA
ncbi:MAG: cytochrome P450 [Ilumatobacteraceae bacterium]